MLNAVDILALIVSCNRNYYGLITEQDTEPIGSVFATALCNTLLTHTPDNP